MFPYYLQIYATCEYIHKTIHALFLMHLQSSHVKHVILALI